MAADDDAIKVAQDELAAATDKLTQANTTLVDDTAALAVDEVGLGVSVAANGPYFVGPKEDGTVDAYLSDGETVYHVVNLKPSSGPA